MRKILIPIMLVLFFYGCASIKTAERGHVNAPMAKAVQDTKDALNTYGFDLKDIAESGSKSRVTAERDDHQKAWVEIESGAGSSSTVEVKVNREGHDSVGADVIFKDIKGRSARTP